MVNIFNFLFGKKEKPKAPVTVDVMVEQVLREDQKTKAIRYYKDNKDRVDFMVRQTDKAYEPSQTEDKNDPRIWKAEHWNWFLTAMEADD